MRRLLVVSPLFPNNKQPSKGTFVKQCLLQLRNHFDLRAVSPIPWASRLAAGIHHRDVIDGIEAWYPPYFRVPRSGHSLDGVFYYLSLLAFMKRLVDRYACDAIIAHWAYPDAFGVTLMNHVLKKPIFIQVHGSDINSGTRSQLSRKMIGFALRRARAVFSVAYDLQEKIVALGIERDRICVIPNGADHAEFCPRDRTAVRANLGLPLQKKIVLFVGNLVDVKGLPYLIEAAAVLSRNRNDLLFLILGDGPQKERLHELILQHRLQGEVCLLGSKLHDDIPYWMSACDAFCLPSLSEGCPTVVIEALASGRPVVGTEVGDVPRLLKMPTTGYTVRPGDGKALADAITQTLARAWDPYVLSRSVLDLTWENTARTICARVSAELQGLVSECPVCDRPR
jgi:glycosyltransferase involved in cell wall biosynthesis